mmetsp:Transcript_19310/g.29617  ORF Transcript_19310/g.29617 Transcript_19310/m.29617 type:complete len:216 (-) Transcript_19310:535-1182(-)
MSRVRFQILLKPPFVSSSVISAYQILLGERGDVVALAHLPALESTAVGRGIVNGWRFVGHVEAKHPLDGARVFVLKDTPASLVGYSSEVELVNGRRRAVGHRLGEDVLYVPLPVDRIQADVSQRFLLVLPLENIVLHQGRILSYRNAIDRPLKRRTGLLRDLIALSLEGNGRQRLVGHSSGGSLEMSRDAPLLDVGVFAVVFGIHMVTIHVLFVL